ncbi:MAG: acyl-ACP--UDP-N-acetylglucosamine O-acyltransferase [Gammaproteobacteria bacterium]|nr:acyl-ACP--UDP-N-acetylglucosamine O-acyltransferase [Gammaproteobacteria bacterium]
MKIHETAVVSAEAHLESGVSIGPYAVVEDNVYIGRDTIIGPHAVIHSYVKLGTGNRIHAHAVIGDLPQDIGYSGDRSWVIIGDNNVIREQVTVHRSTNEERPTTLGSGCFLMTQSHVGHDCQIADGVILTNCATLAGHVQVGVQAVLGGLVPVHQFVRIGCYAMVGGNTGIRKDVLPYSMVSGEPARHFRLNTIGLRRAGIRGQRYRALEAAFRMLRRGETLDALPATPEIDLLRGWLKAPSKRGLTGFSAVR